MCVHVIWCYERRIWAGTLAFSLCMGDPGRKSSHFMAVCAPPPTPDAVGAGASVQSAEDRKLASGVHAVTLGLGRHGRNPPAQKVIGTDRTGLGSWLLTCRKEKAEVFTDLSVVVGNVGRGVWWHGQE